MPKSESLKIKLPPHTIHVLSKSAASLNTTTEALAAEILTNWGRRAGGFQ